MISNSIAQNENEERFDIKTETKLLKALNKAFEEQNNILTEEEILKKDEVCVIDKTEVMGIEPRTKRAKLILRR